MMSVNLVDSCGLLWILVAGAADARLLEYHELEYVESIEISLSLSLSVNIRNIIIYVLLYYYYYYYYHYHYYCIFCAID